MITPKLNINGSSASDLIEPRRQAMDHLMDAIEALRQAAPNGRDYPGDYDGCAADRDRHFARLERIKAIREELMTEALHIMQQEA